MSGNGLELTMGLKSARTNNDCPITGDGLQQLFAVSFPKQDGLVLAYFYNKVLFGRFSDGNLHFYHDALEPRDLLELRVFNQERELHLKRKGDVFRGRLRIDNEGGECEAVDADQVLWGNAGKVADGWVELKETRGFQLIVPYDGELKPRLAIRTRNYIGYNELGQAGYVDCRMFDLVGRGEK